MAADASPIPHEPIAPEIAALAAAEGLGAHRFTIHPHRFGALFLRKGGKLRSWSTKAVKDVPNFFLFLALVEQLRRTD